VENITTQYNKRGAVMKKILLSLFLATSLVSMDKQNTFFSAQDSSLIGHEQQQGANENAFLLSPSDKEAIHPWQSPYTKSIQPKTPQSRERKNVRKRDFLPPLITPENASKKETFKSDKRPRALSPIKLSLPDNRPFFRAVERGDCLYVQNEAKRNSFMRSKNQNGETPLHVAIRTCHEDMVKTLLELGADPYEPNNEGLTSLDLAQQKVAQIQAERDARKDYDMGHSISCPEILRILNEHQSFNSSRQLNSLHTPLTQKPSDPDSIYNYLSGDNQPPNTPQKKDFKK